MGTCEGPYRVFEDVYAQGGTPFIANSQATVQQCIYACNASMTCVGFDYSIQRNPRCWHHFDAANLDMSNIGAMAGNLHYRFDVTCGPRRKCSRQ